jgi:hypothetical protein
MNLILVTPVLVHVGKNNSFELGTVELLVVSYCDVVVSL